MATIFPSFAGLALPITRTPIWRTLIQESIAGVVTPQAPWTYPRYQWNLPFDFFRQATAYKELQSIIGFYNQMAGRYGTFLYYDPNDSTSGTNQSVGVGDSTNKSFQLVRAYGSFTEPVFGMATDSTRTVTVLVDTTVVSTGSYAISNKGILTFSSTAGAPPSGQTVSWNGTFGWYCRFAADQYKFEQFTASSDYQGPLWNGKLAFESVKFGA